MAPGSQDGVVQRGRRIKLSRIARCLLKVLKLHCPVCETYGLSGVLRRKRIEFVIFVMIVILQSNYLFNLYR